MFAPQSYLIRIMARLAEGVSLVSEPERRRHAQFIKSRQQSDGGFGGREGGSDPYYTSFALRALAMLGELDADTATACARYLRDRPTETESTVDLISAVISVAVLDAAAGVCLVTSLDAWHQQVAARLERLRCADGGYAKASGGAAGSTYQTFLNMVCYQIMGRQPADPDAVLEFIRQRESPLGGFLEIRVAKRPGTNPTAAAVGTLVMLDGLTPDLEARTAAFLASMQNEEGGFLANSRIPIADLLSTFTGVVTLGDLGALSACAVPAARRFVAACARPQGGYVAAAWDATCDLEYTFYGLASTALLADIRS